MARRKPDPKPGTLRQESCLHPDPEKVTDVRSPAVERVGSVSVARYGLAVLLRQGLAARMLG